MKFSSMSLDAVIAVHIMLMVKLLITSSFAKSLSLTSSLICSAAVKVIILYNAKSPIRPKTSLTILENPSTDQLVSRIY